MVKLTSIKKPRILFMLATLLAMNAAFVSSAFAATLTKPSVIFTNMTNSGGSSLIVVFTTSASNTGTNGQLVFTGWTGSGGTGTVAAAPTVSQTIGTTNCKTITGAANNLPGSPTAAGTAGTGTIAITNTALTASSSYCYVLTNGVTANPTATGQGTVAVTAGTDTAVSVEFDIIGSDTVTVGATVPPSFQFSLSNSTDNFSPIALTTSSVSSTTGITASVSTNAANGWFLFASDSNVGLKSTVQNYTINSGNSNGSIAPLVNTTLSTNHEGYVTAVPAASVVQGVGSGGTTSGSATFASTATGQGAGLNTQETQIASSTGTANGASVLVKEYASIGATTPAATDYSDTITMVAGGSF